MIDFRKVATIQAWSALVWGVVLLVIPSPILGILAIQADPSDLLLARLAGAMLFALAASLIVARDTTEEDQRSRLAFGNATADLAMVIVIGAATFSGVIGPVGYVVTALFGVNVASWVATRVGTKPAS